MEFKPLRVSCSKLNIMHVHEVAEAAANETTNNSSKRNGIRIKLIEVDAVNNIVHRHLVNSVGFAR